MNTKRLIAALLALCMLLCMVPATQTHASVQGDYTYTVNNGKATITDYSGAGGAITIPAVLGNYPVTHIGNQAFMGCTGLTSVVIPNSVTEIGASAFYNCTGLKSLTIPDSVILIGGRALPTENNMDYNEYDNALYLGDEENPYRFLIKAKSQSITSCQIHENTKYIYQSAFSQCKLTSIEIPEGVWLIGAYAFSYNSALTTVTIPHSVTTIHTGAFTICGALTDVYYAGSQRQWNKISKTSSTFDTSNTSLQFHFQPEEPIASGDCGEAMTWTVYDTGALEIVGSGEMNNFDSAPWSEYADSIRELDLSEDVYTIGSYAFCNINIQSIDLPDDIHRIGNYAFSGCNELKKVDLPENLIEIGQYAFFNCSKLETIKIPAYTCDIYSGAFAGCSSLDGIWVDEESIYYSNDENGVLYNGSKTQLYAFPGSYTGSYTLPSAVQYVSGNLEYVNGLTAFYVDENNTVYSDRGGVLYDKSGKTLYKMPAGFTGAYTVPEGVTTISANAMRNCTKLTAIDISNSVYKLEEAAFYGCISLSAVTMPSSAYEIPASFFQNCAGLQSVTIPENVYRIEEAAFAGCTGLIEINYLGTRSRWEELQIAENNDVLQNVTVLFPNDTGDSETDDNIPDSDPTSGTCGENLEWSMSEDGVLTISGSGDMTSAPWSSYSYMIQDVILSEGLTSITDFAFYGASIENVTIPSTVTNIGQFAFFACGYLQKIDIPAGVAKIGMQAFGSCANLQTVSIPASVTELNDTAFTACLSLKRFNVDANNPNYCSDASGALLDKAQTKLIQLPSGIVGSYTILDTVTAIDSSAIYYCDNLTALHVSEDNPTYTSVNGILYNKEKTTLLKAPGALSGACTIPNGVTSIAAQAFNGCSKMTAVTIPDSVTTLDFLAFGGCDSLTSVVLPEGVTSIPDSGFVECENLQSLTIPTSVTSIGYSAFAMSPKLTDIYYLGTQSQWEQIEIADYNNELLNMTIHYEQTVEPSEPDQPAGSSGSCGDNATWEMDEEGTVTITGTGAITNEIAGNANVVDIVVSEGVTAIGEQAFFGCENLQTVVLPESVETIGAGAFYNCSSLETIVIPETVTTVGAEAFAGCTSLSEAIIGKYINSKPAVRSGNAVNTQIESAAFAGCIGLTKVTLGNSVTSIGDLAFDGCDNLQQVTYCGTEDQWNAVEIGEGNSLLIDMLQYHDYADGVCNICGHEDKHTHTWENGACTGCGQVLTEAIDLNVDGKISAFDAQILAEANAGRRELTAEQWKALGDLTAADIINYVLGRFDTAE